MSMGGAALRRGGERLVSTMAEPRTPEWSKHGSGLNLKEGDPFRSDNVVKPEPEAKQADTDLPFSSNQGEEDTGEEAKSDSSCNTVCPQDFDPGFDEISLLDSSSCHSVRKTADTDCIEDHMAQESPEVYVWTPDGFHVDPLSRRRFLGVRPRTAAILDLRPYIEMALKAEEDCASLSSSDSDSSDELGC